MRENHLISCVFGCLNVIAFVTSLLRFIFRYLYTFCQKVKLHIKALNRCCIKYIVYLSVYMPTQVFQGFDLLRFL